MPNNYPTPLEVGQLARTSNLGKLHEYLDKLHRRVSQGSEYAAHDYQVIVTMFKAIQRDEKNETAS